MEEDARSGLPSEFFFSSAVSATESSLRVAATRGGRGAPATTHSTALAAAPLARPRPGRGRTTTNLLTPLLYITMHLAFLIGTFLS